MTDAATSRDPVSDLRRIAFLLERANEATYRVRAFRGAATAIDALDSDELRTRAEASTLTNLTGVGDVTARCVAESLRGEEPVYLRRLMATADIAVDETVDAMRRALRGDCHSHTDWSDGGSPLDEMVAAAIDVGHSYVVVTDHSPRLTVAHGLSADRLREQLDVIAALNETISARGSEFRVLTGIEVDILADGSLDQDEALLAELDVVVASVHSGLRDDAAVMTRRMVAAVTNPHVDILGHCTGRRLAAEGSGDGGDRSHRRSGGRTGGRPESQFDPDAVFDACARTGTAVEINCRPDRLDPPKRLLRRALESGCLFAIDTDAHAPGQLDWLTNGCERAVRCGVPVERIVNSWSLPALRRWTVDRTVPATTA